MAKKKTIEEKSVEELHKDLKSQRTLNWIALVILVPLFYLGIKNSIEEKALDPVVIVGIATTSIFFLHWENRKKIMAELEKRGG